MFQGLIRSVRTFSARTYVRSRGVTHSSVGRSVASVCKPTLEPNRQAQESNQTGLLARPLSSPDIETNLKEVAGEAGRVSASFLYPLVGSATRRTDPGGITCYKHWNLT